jgi:hypothetical protein
MNSDTHGKGNLPVPRSYMVLGDTLVQVRRGKRVAFGKYEWTGFARVGTQTFVAGERPDHMTFTYEQDRELRERYNV